MAGWAYSHRAGDEAAFRGELASGVKVWHNPLHHHQRASSRLCEHTPHNLGAEGSLLCAAPFELHFPGVICPANDVNCVKHLSAEGFLALPFFALIHRDDANLPWNRPTRLQPVFITFCTFPVRDKFLIRIGLQGFLYNSKYCNRRSQTPNVLKKILLPILFFCFIFVFYTIQ